MSILAHTLTTSRLAGRVFDERQLGEVLGGSAARRYGLVNRALKDGSLIRVKRGSYMLAAGGQQSAVHPFAVAQTLVTGSYVSFETALAFHGWIPEAVHVTASVTPGRKSAEYDTSALGRFTFHPLAIRDYQFLAGVERQKLGALTAFVASPLRALLDLAASRKVQWSGLEWLTSGLRIDEAQLGRLTRKDFAALKPVYKHKAVNAFLASLELAVRGSSPLPGDRGDD